MKKALDGIGFAGRPGPFLRRYLKYSKIWLKYSKVSQSLAKYRKVWAGARGKRNQAWSKVMFFKKKLKQLKAAWDRCFEESLENFQNPGMKAVEPPPIRLVLGDVLDLHTFHPRDVEELLYDYLNESLKKGVWSVRIIHGKGKGIQKRRVLAFLEKSPIVRSYKDAPSEAGGWGATLAELGPAKNQS